MSAFESASAFESTQPQPPLFNNDFFNMTTPANANSSSVDISSVPSLISNPINYDQQNAFKLQQLEAIRIIQISLDKLASATTVPITMPVNQSAGENSQASTVFVYKDTNLHKNLLVSKILNKAKFCYYQSIIQSMRFSLMSKLNYYSALIQQLNATQSEKSNSTDENNNGSMSMNYDETSIIDEMKMLMQQIWQETYQFNFNNPLYEPFDPNFSTSTQTCNDTNSNREINSDRSKETAKVAADSADLKSKLSEPSVSNETDTEQKKRIKQLNDVKLSLYSLLFNQSGSDLVDSNVDDKSECSTKTTNENLKRKRQSKKDNQEEVLDVVTVNDSSEKLSPKKLKSDFDVDEDCCTAKPTTVNVNSKTGHADILNDDTNVIKNKMNHVSYKEKSSKNETVSAYGLARYQHRNNRLLPNRLKPLKVGTSMEEKSKLEASSTTLLSRSLSSTSSDSKMNSRSSVFRSSPSSNKSSKLLPSFQVLF